MDPSSALACLSPELPIPYCATAALLLSSMPGEFLFAKLPTMP
jgi:hypothetical protein